jgi:probable HAF family extracellular repeat protein
MQDLGMLPDASQCVATAINDSGQVVGSCFGSSSSAFVWSQDTGIAALGPVGSGAHAINNQGDIVGQYVSGDDDQIHAFLVRNGEFQDLGLGVAYGINDNGLIVGWSARHAASWDQQGIHDLGTLEGDTGSSAAYAVNAAGLIAGASTDGGPQNEQHAALWNGYGIGNLGTVGQGFHSSAQAINGGLIVGTSDTTPQGDMTAFLYDNNGPGYPVNLNTLIPADSGWTLVWGYGVNAAGQIVGGGGIRDQDGQRAFLLTPVDQPSTGR